MEKGFELMAAGMGVVFFFLVLLVVVMIIAARILKNFDKPEQLSAATGGGMDSMAQVAVAIAAAKRHSQS